MVVSSYFASSISEEAKFMQENRKETGIIVSGAGGFHSACSKHCPSYGGCRRPGRRLVPMSSAAGRRSGRLWKGRHML